MKRSLVGLLAGIGSLFDDGSVIKTELTARFFLHLVRSKFNDTYSYFLCVIDLFNTNSLIFFFFFYQIMRIQ